jgi:amino acid adenylation domain-containing protein
MSDLSTLVADLPLEQQAIKAKCCHPSGTFIEFSKDEVEQSIPARFERIVRQYPDRLAIKTGQYAFTYDALNKAANRVARAILTRRGSGEEPVMLLLEQGAPVIVGLLAVLKAGKFYVPLDPSHPRARTDHIIENAQSGLIVTNNQNLPLATELVHSGCRLLNIEKLDSRLSTENPNLATSPDAFACLLYTSGSTGQPKGVIQNHRNGLHSVWIRTECFHFCPDDRMTLFAFANSAAKSNIYNALLNGAALYPRDIKAEGVANLATWLIQEEITVWNSGAPLLRHFLDTLTGEETFPQLRLIKLGSEQVSKRDVERYKKHFSPDCVLVNTLSSTETGTLREYFIDKETPITSSTVPVGYAVEDKEVLLLDDAGQDVGRNSVGEITVSSCYLSPGYWRWPDLTQTAFHPDPRGGSARVYRTGDLGRLLPDGCLEHLGRKDFQVKIRGYRVEVAEIEMALLALESIKAAVVVAREDQPGRKRLVAYMVPVEKSPPTVSTLRHALAEKFPDYMIPSAFVMLRALPLTPNGKVDRPALPAPEGTRPDLDTPFAAPRTAVEEELTQIWAEVLSFDQVGIHDNFFDLGGHSLAATQIIARVVKRFQLELPIQFLFQAPTVAEMAAVIAQGRETKLGEGDLARILAEVEAYSDKPVQRN